MIGGLGAADPREVGRYRMLAELGRGGMGRVLLGAGPDGRLVAVKLVRAQLVEDDDFRERFRREVTASRKVSGAYTAAVVDADANAATPWLASVFVPGPSLQDAVRAAGPLPADSVSRLAAGLAAALVDVHRAGLVHRDLKPSNVLLAADGPRVIDFGIARAADSEGGSEITHTGWLIGSPGFMSPEQAEGREVTAASDVFSLGCVLYLACTGKGPFAGPSTPQTLYNVVHAEPDLSAVPDRVRPIIERCLAKEPADRPEPTQLLEELAGEIAPTARPWPRAVHDLIDRQHAEITELLEPQEELTVAVDGDSATLAITRGLLGPWVPPRDPSDDQLTGIVRPQRKHRTDAPVRGVAFASVAVLVSVLVWAMWPAARSGSSSSPGSETTTTTTSYEDDYYDTTTEETETTETAETTTDDGADTAETEDYADPTRYAQPGECLWGEAPDRDWESVSCDDYVLEVLEVLEGPSDHDDCDDRRVPVSVDYANESSPELSVRVCLTFRYGNDGAFARTDDCMVWSGEDEGPMFTDCANATHYVTGYHDEYDPAFCGDDGWYGWNDDDAEWAEYLNFTVCLRRV